LLFIAAEPRECQPFLRHWTDVADPQLPVHWSRAGKLQGRQCLMIANGAGVARAGLAMAAAPPAGAICSIGFCGALDPGLKIGEVFVASEVRNGTGRWQTARPAGPVAAEGPLQTAQ